MFRHEKVELGYEDLSCVTRSTGRKYTTPNKKEYPSITTVLSAKSKEAIKAWRARVGEEEANKISQRASIRGTAVHAIIEKYLNNEEDFREGYMPHIIQSFNDVRPHFDQRIGTVYGQEIPLYSDHLGVAGRVDCVAEFDGKLSIIDFKTSLKPKKKEWVESYFQQECFYAIAWEERTGMPITQLVTIIAVDNAAPQVFIEHRDDWVPALRESILQFNLT